MSDIALCPSEFVATCRMKPITRLMQPWKNLQCCKSCCNTCRFTVAVNTACVVSILALCAREALRNLQNPTTVYPRQHAKIRVQDSSESRPL